MTDRMDVLSVRESGDKSYWTRVGVAFPAKTGEGWTLLLDAMPASTDGQYKLMMRPPKDNHDSGSRQGGGGFGVGYR